MTFALIALLALAAAPDAPPDDATAWYQTGQRLLAEGDAAGAAAAFQAARETGWESAALYLGWGHAELAAGRPALARLQLERARRMQPEAPLVRDALAQSLDRLDLAPSPDGPLRRTAERMGSDAARLLVALGLVLGAVAGGLVAWALWERRARAWRRRTALVAAAVAGVAAGIGLAASSELDRERAVVVAPDGADLHEAVGGRALRRLPAGALVAPLGAQGDWRHVRTEAAEGWVRARAVEAL